EERDLLRRPRCREQQRREEIAVNGDPGAPAPAAACGLAARDEPDGADLAAVRAAARLQERGVDVLEHLDRRSAVDHRTRFRQNHIRTAALVHSSIAPSANTRMGKDSAAAAVAVTMIVPVAGCNCSAGALNQ